MSEIFTVSPTMLKEHKKTSALIPEMTDKEWDKFFSNVQEEGIRQPLDINTSYEVLDGRHRLRAALKLGLNKIEVRQHDFTPGEEMKFVRDTAVERRSLTDEQRLNIVLEADELIKSIYEEGKKTKSKTTSESNKRRYDKTSQFSSVEENREKPHNSIKQVAELAGTSPSKVSKMKKLKKENPASYKDVVDGKVTVYKAYNDLPTVVNNHDKNRSRKTKAKNHDASSTKEELKKHKPKHSNQQPADMTEEEKDRAMFEANISTFFMHLNEVHGFFGRTKNIERVVKTSVERDSATMKDFKVTLNKIIELMEGI